MKKNQGNIQFSLLKKSWSFISEVYSNEWFSPHSSFLRLKSFWAPTLTIVVIFCLLCWKISIEQGLKIGLNWTIEDMYNWFKIPLWFLALLIPVLGLCNANHKSEQARAAMTLTQKSIELSGEQNRFSNYYKHAEEFQKHCKAIEINNVHSQLKITSKKLHSTIYPKAKLGEFKACSKPIIMYEAWLNSLNISFQLIIDNTKNGSISKDSIPSTLKILLEPLIKELSKIINFKSTPENNIIDDEIVSHWGLSTEDAYKINTIYKCYHILIEILEFDSDIENNFLCKYKALQEILINFQKLGIELKYGITPSDIDLPNTEKKLV